MAYCGPRGIPLSTFLDWPEADQDAALEWAAREAARCSACGTWHDEWDVPPEQHPWHAHPQMCPGTKYVTQLQNSPRFRDAPAGLQFVLAHGPAVRCRTCNPALAAPLTDN